MVSIITTHRDFLVFFSINDGNYKNINYLGKYICTFGLGFTTISTYN